MKDKALRPNVRKRSLLINRHFVDFYYPVCYFTKFKKRLFIGKKKGIVKFKTLEEAKTYGKRFVIKYNKPKG